MSELRSNRFFRVLFPARSVRPRPATLVTGLLVPIVAAVVVSGGILASAQAVAADRGFANYDGDTLRATFRIENIDTPEIKGACERERQLAQRAKAFTTAWLAKGHVTIRQTGMDRYGRVLARVERAGEDLGEALVKAGLARPWKGKREAWC